MGFCNSKQFSVDDKKWYHGKIISRTVHSGDIDRANKKYGSIQFVFTDYTATKSIDIWTILESYDRSYTGVRATVTEKGLLLEDYDDMISLGIRDLDPEPEYPDKSTR